MYVIIYQGMLLPKIFRLNASINSQKYNVKDGTTHRYIIIIVIIRASTKRFTQCKKLTSKLSREKIMSVILDTKYHPISISENWC